VILLAVHQRLWEIVSERFSPVGGQPVTIVDRAPANFAIDCAESQTEYALLGDLVMLSASDPHLAALALEVAPLCHAQLRRTASLVDAPLAQAVADSGGLGLAVVGDDLSIEPVRDGANTLIAVLGSVLSRLRLGSVNAGDHC
jgi:hypothetical protein